MTSSIDQKKWALRFTGDQAVDCGTIDDARLAGGFTLEAWIRPASTDGGVAAFEGDRFEGRPVAFAPGRYDDLSKFRVGAGRLASLRVPPGYRAILFDKTGCCGAARTLDDDAGHLGDWHQRAHSLVVIDTSHRRQQVAVVYTDSAFAGNAQALDLRAYPDLAGSAIGEKSISSLEIPPGLEVTLYEQPGCKGASLRLQGEVAYVGNDWNDRARSAIVSRAAVPAVADEVIVYDKRRFEGASQTFKVGCYRDLSAKAVGKAAISSLQVPPGLEVVLFDQPGLAGASRSLSAGASDLGSWDHKAQSLLVAAVFGGSGGIDGDGVQLFHQAGFKGKVWHLPLGRYEDLAATAGPGSLRIPQGFDVVLFDQTGCKGHYKTLHADADDLGDWAGKAQSAIVARRCGIFDNPAGTGLSLEIAPAAGLREQQEQFAGTRIRADRWFHVAVTWNGSELAQWLDGRKVAAKPRKQAPAFTGTWTMGQGFEGEIGLVALRAGVRDPRALALRRFEMPDKQDPDLVAAWTLEEGAQATAAPERWVRIIARHSGKCVQVKGAGTENGARIEQWDYEGKPHQQWRVEEAEKGWYKILNRGSGRCLCVYAGQPQAGAPVHQWEYLGAPDHQWSLEPAGEGWSLLRVRHSKLVLDVLGWSRDNGGVLGQYTAGQQFGNQQFRLEDVTQAIPAVELLSKRKAMLPPNETFWVHAALPTHPLDTGLGQSLLLAARQQNQTLLQQAKVEAQEKIEKAHAKAQAHVDEAHARATAMAHANSFEVIRYLSGGQLAGVTPDGQVDPSLLSIDRSRWPGGTAVWWAGQIANEPGRVAVSWARQVAIWPSGSKLVVVSLKTGAELRLLEGLDELLAFDVSPDGSRVAACSLKEVRIWDLDSGKCLNTFSLEGNGPGRVRFYDNGRNLIASSSSNMVVVTDFASGNPAFGYRHPNNSSQSYAQDIAVTDVDPPRVVLAMTNGNLWVWQLGNAWPREFAANANRVRLSTWRALTGANEDLKLWSTESGDCIRVLKGHTNQVTAFEIYRNGYRIISAARDGTLRIWDLDLGVELEKLEGHSSAVLGLAVHEVRQIAVSCGEDRTVKVWDLRSGECLRTLRGHRRSIEAVFIDPSGTRVASCSADCVKVWDLGQGQVLSDVAVDPAAKTTYVGRTLPNGGVGYYFAAESRWLQERRGPVYAVAIDPTGSDETRRFIYWIEGDGDIYRMRMDGQGGITTVFENASPGHDREWHLAVDPKRQRLVWSNGREIWGGPLLDSGQLAGAQVLVPHGVSPYPAAVQVDDRSGDLLWIDLQDDAVRRLDSALAVRDLYEAPNPRAGLALDVEANRVLWTASQKKTVEAAVIDDPGLFAWFESEKGKPAQRVQALEDARLIGVRWGAPVSAASSMKDREVMYFDGGSDHVDLGPLYLDSSKGLTLEAWALWDDVESFSRILELGNGPDADTIALGYGPNGFVFQTSRCGVNYNLYGRGPLQQGVWTYVAATIDAVGEASVYVNGAKILGGSLLTPRPVLQTRNYVGRSSWDVHKGFKGQIALLRVWNECLGADRIRANAADLLADQSSHVRGWSRSMMEYISPRPYLMSGAMDGLEPAVPLFELAADGSLALQSKTAAAHQQLVGAQRKQAAAEVQARIAAAAARKAAHDKVQAAHDQNAADHAAAQQKIAGANADADRSRRDAHQRLTAAPEQARQRIEKARDDAKRSKEEGERQAQKIQDDAQKQKRDKIAAAHKDLSDAQKHLSDGESERSKY